MMWCYMCSTEYSDGSAGKVARGGSWLCDRCVQTPRGQTETEDSYTRDRRLFGDAPGSHVKGDRWRKAVKAWQRQGPVWPLSEKK